MPLFSIIIPAYNAERSIETTIYSIINQNFTNLEIIVVNDGSSDNTWQKLKKISSKHDNVRIYNQGNTGPFCARNEAIRLAVGDYLIFLDSDDYLAKNALVEMSNIVDENDCDVFLFKWKIKKNQNMIEGQPLFNHLESFNQKNKKKLLMRVLQSSKLNSLGIKLVKRSIIDIKEFKNFNTKDLKNGEDLILSLQIFTNANTFLYIDKPWYIYVQNSVSTTHTFNQTYYSNIKQVHLFLEHYTKKWDIDDRMLKNILNERFLINVVKTIPHKSMSDTQEKSLINSYLMDIKNDEMFKEKFKQAKNSKIKIRYKLILSLLQNNMFDLCIYIKSISKLKKVGG